MICFYLIIMDNYYDSIAEGYEELHREEQELKISFIKLRLPTFFEIKPEHKLLDVGCGTGVTTIPWNCNRTGLDPAKQLLNKANQKNEINYILAKAEKIPFENNLFDIVTSITAIQNFSDLEKGLSEIKRVGKKNFILTYLKKSSKAEIIEKIINEKFEVLAKFEEDKDIIFFLKKEKSIPLKA